MSPSAYIVRRVKVNGAWVSSKTARPDSRDDRRYVVRYRFGPGNARSAGSFKDEAAAIARRRWVEQRIAEGRGREIPALLRGLEEQGMTVALAMAAALASRPNPGAATRKRFRVAIAQLGELAATPIAEVSWRDVQRWVNAMSAGGLAPSTVRQYLIPLRQAFEQAEIAPNPAGDSRIVLPLHDEGEEVDPPSAAEFEAMIARTPRYRDALVVLEGTGLRIAELVALTWADVDLSGGRIRVARGRTKRRSGGRRFIPISPRVEAVLRRQADVPARIGRVFPAITDGGARHAMARACTKGGIRHFHPHDLRDRWISLNLIAGVPVELVARMAGHRKTSMTLDVYSHVVLDEPPQRLDELRRGVRLVFGLADDPSPGDVLPANEGGDETMGVTGLDSSEA